MAARCCCLVEAAETPPLSPSFAVKKEMQPLLLPMARWPLGESMVYTYQRSAFSLQKRGERPPLFVLHSAFLI